MSIYNRFSNNEMNRDRDFERYGLKGIDVSAGARSEQRCVCPECEASRTHKGQKDCAVNVDRGVWYCHHCKRGGVVPTRRLERLQDAVPAQGKWKRPEWHGEFVVGNVALGANAGQQRVIDYLTGVRRLSVEVLTRARVTVTPWVMDGKGEYAMCFNYFDRGVLVNAKKRSLGKEFTMFPGAEVIPYNVDAIVRRDVCYVTEGELDALSMMEAGYDASVSVPTGGGNVKCVWLDRFVETHFMDKRMVVLAMDNDVVGRGMVRELVRRLGADRCRVVMWDEGCKDANEELVAHGVEGVRRCVEGAVAVPLQGVQSLGQRRMAEELDALFVNGLPRGAETGLKALDDVVRFETGRFMVVTGRPGDGKSELVDEIVLRLCQRHGWRVAYFSPENVPVSYHASKLVSKLSGQAFGSSSGMSREVYEKCKAWLGENVCHIMPGVAAEVDSGAEGLTAERER